MKTTLVSKGESGTVQGTVVDVPQPSASSLQPTQLLIKVHVSGSNPKDWKIPCFVPQLNNTNSGDDVGGTVAAVGSKVSEFRVGDRVSAFHEMTTEHGSFAEYAVVWEHTTFHIPETTSFEEAASIPLAAMTAAVGLFTSLGLPEPWNHDVLTRERSKGGVAVYGAASAVGAYVVKLLRKAEIHPIICVAGNGIDFVEGLIDRSKGDTIIDYRKGGDAIVSGLKSAIPSGQTLRYAYDAVSDHGSYGYLCQVLDTKAPGGAHLTVVLPGKKFEGIPEGVNLTITMVGSVHKPVNRDFGYAWFRLFGQGLKDGWFTPHPHEVVPGGLGGVGEGLSRLQNGKVSAKKMVFRIADTEGVTSSKI
ncbi:hypothetical protein H2198_002309 [Neophaeococcomyces mojaviensis]|uniref:Uncharacterized protein n=1 Tax=Neophaeococcomyces mojaviensis TaxID=3383035 RepID=A0ACC3AEB9_9EURO|nr:hypothetical protein H2198_002309 [Knufia sp. JES_112]